MQLISGCILLLFTACKHEDLEITKENENFRVAADFIKNNYDLTLFSAAIEKSGMTSELRGAGPFTVLAPRNAAFQEIGINNASDFDRMNADSLKQLVQRHILTERLLSGDVPSNGVDIRYRTLAGTEIYASQANISKYGPLSDAFLFFNGAQVIRTNVNLANGMLHVLNKVMKYTPKSTVQDWLSKRPQYSIFVSGLKKFGLWDKLATEGPYTVFAPQNVVFEQNGITAATIAAMTTTAYSGPKLFGSYVYEKKHFFISDFFVFSQTTAESFYTRKVDNDNWYATVSIARDYSNTNLTYSVKLRTALIYPYEEYGSAPGGLPALTDNLTDNGLVHDLKGLLLLPEQALIQ